MNRRNFLAAMASPFIGRLLPKQEPSIVEVVQPRMDAAAAQMSIRLTEICYSSPKAYRKITYVGEMIIEDTMRPVYWHGQSPFVFMDLSKPVPWKTYSQRLS